LRLPAGYGKGTLVPTSATVRTFTAWSGQPAVIWPAAICRRLAVWTRWSFLQIA